MKQLAIITFFLWGIMGSIYGQKPIKIGKNIDYQVVAPFVNSVYVGDYIGFNIDLIDSIKIVKEPVNIDGKLFKNQIHCFSSKDFKFISFQELIEKNKPKYSPIFIFNGKVLISEYIYSFKMDENYLLALKYINSDELGYFNGDEQFTLVFILTKTQENLQRYRKISNPYPLANDSVEWEKHRLELQEWFRK